MGEFEEIFTEYLTEELSLVKFTETKEFQMVLKIFAEVVEEAKKEFPIHFKMDVVTGGDYDEKTESFTPTVVTPTYPKNLPLPEYKANAFIIKGEVIDWFVKWFGE